MPERSNRHSRVHARLVLLVAAGVGCAPTDNVIGVQRAGTTVVAGSAGVGITMGGGTTAGEGATAGGETGNSRGGTAGMMPSGLSGAGGGGSSPLATAGITSSGGSSAGSGGLVSPAIAFQSPVEYVTGDAPRSLALGDLNADGKLDIVTANWVGGSVSVLLGAGDGTFLPKVDYATAATTNWLALGDLNGDHVLDIALVAFDADTVKALFGAGDGSFGQASVFPGSKGMFSLTLGDVNGDAKLDMVTSPGSGENGSVGVFLGAGDGSFAEAKYWAKAGASFSAELADVNGDGALDLARVNAEADSLTILRGTGDGSFDAGEDYATGDHPLFVAFGDLNSDGQLDLVTADADSDELGVRLGTGNGEFGARVPYTTQTYGYPSHVLLADLNGDQRLDLIAPNMHLGSVSVSAGAGDGTFALSVEYASGQLLDRSPQVTAAADLNADGIQDLAVVNTASNRVGILLGTHAN